MSEFCERILAPPGGNHKPLDKSPLGSIRKDQKKMNQQQYRKKEKMQPTQIVFGDGMFSSTSKGSAPGPYKRLFKELKHYSPNNVVEVLKFNENRTSRVCPCGSDVRGPLGLSRAERDIHPRHRRKKKEKRNESEDEERYPIPGVRVCTHTECRTTWNRDTMAALNILRKFEHAALHDGAVLPEFQSVFSTTEVQQPFKKRRGTAPTSSRTATHAVS